MSISLTTHLGPDDAAIALGTDVHAGLTATPKTLPPRWFYDERGSELFDDITRLPEYYPTRTERAILAARADEIAAVSGAETLVELGSGTSEKTRLLVSALRQAGTLRRFVPFDVDPSVLRSAAAAITAEYPGVAVDAVVGDFTRHLGQLPREGRRLIAFLGSTIGNLEPGAAHRLPDRAGRRPVPGGLGPARHRPGEGAGKAGARLRRRGRRHGRLQPKRAGCR